MKKLLAILALGFVSVQANALTIDFEEFAPVTAFEAIGVTSLDVNPGFTMELENPASALWAVPCCTGNETSQVQIIALDTATITFSQQSGGAFSLQSLDMAFIGYGNNPNFNLRGEYSDGSGVDMQVVSSILEGESTWETVLFSGQFDNIVSLTISGADRPVQLDNITVTAVPLPAAAWLLGSGLVALGWLRRRP